jgi:glutamate-5-semialdehyde dehydrogenase
MTIFELCKNAKTASYEIATLDRAKKDAVLAVLADAILANTAEIMAANKLDVLAATDKPPQFVDRLTLTEKRIKDIADGVRAVIALDDPVGEVLSEWTTDKGLRIVKKTVPLGVIGIIYEARPNVTVDTAALCLKSGNAVVLRGSKDAINSNIKLVKVIKDVLKKSGLNASAVQLVEDTTREGAKIFMTCNKYVDVLVPRGSASLIQTTVENSTIPVIETGAGNCHVYIEKTADIEQAKKVLLNAKTSRTSVCNSCESLLIDSALIDKVPEILNALAESGVEIRGCERVLKVFKNAKAASEDDYFEEFLSLIISVKIVDTLTEAVAHINKYGTKHSEAILSTSETAIKAFTDGVDAAAVYVNASTRFTDGFEFGFGAELGISTQKLHARGPLGLRELTSYKYIVTGEGHIRN